jgi:L-ascorbate metabolism protein UlaG (beta-lactamase superfamily)
VEVRRLAWAGIEVEADGASAVIDLVEDFSWLHGDNPPVGEIPLSPAPGSIDVGLLTHLHSDHADADALGRALAPDAVVLRPEKSFGGEAELAFIQKSETALGRSALPTRVVAPWQTIEIGPFEITALPAADGFGDPQVSWAIAAEGVRILHAGDTLFHGWWWLSALRHGPFDVAFLPAGGAIADLDPRPPPSPLPAGMDPDQAAVAAHLLGARKVVPIHYGPLHEADNYVQSPDPANTLRTAAAKLGVETAILTPGETLSIQPT